MDSDTLSNECCEPGTEDWGLRTGDLITSTGVRRDVNNSVFVAGLKPIRGLIWSLKSEHRARARHHFDKNMAVTTSSRDGASNGQSPKISTTEQHLQSQEQETCQHWEDKKVNNRLGKSQHVRIQDGASVMSGPIVIAVASVAVLSDHLISGGKTRQTSIVPWTWDQLSVRKQLLPGEKMMTPVRRKTCLTPCSAPSSWTTSQCK